MPNLISVEAYAVDVVGIPNHGVLRIGDTPTEDEDLRFTGVPHLAPEILRRVRLHDARKARKLRAAWLRLLETGRGRELWPQGGVG